MENTTTKEKKSSPEVREFPKEETNVLEKAKEKENLLRNKIRSNEFEVTKDNTMASTTCATKIGLILFLFNMFNNNRLPINTRKSTKLKNKRISQRKGNKNFKQNFSLPLSRIKFIIF